MHLYYNDINDAFTGIVKGFHTGKFGLKVQEVGRSDYEASYEPPISRTKSRNGEVLVIEEPVTITYANPLHRVLFNAARDCNPFFHVIESLWMLAGCNDLEPLVHFNKEMAKFSDDGATLWGAYGKRWRDWFVRPDFASLYEPEGSNPMIDQLTYCTKALANRSSRRVVLGMWDAETDLPRIVEQPDCKDVPCNLCVIFQPRKEYWHHLSDYRVLDMTVINRSNDMLLGALGANYVHFSFLHEYMALAAGFGVGKYNQISNNLHVYVSPKEEGSRWLPTKCQPEELLKAAFGNRRWCGNQYDFYYNRHYYQKPHHVPLFYDLNRFEQEIQYLFEAKMWRAESIQDFVDTQLEWRSPFMRLVAIPMILAFNAHKRRDYIGAIDHCKGIKSGDWCSNCVDWLVRRERNYALAKEGGVHASSP